MTKVNKKNWLIIFAIIIFLIAIFFLIKNSEYKSKNNCSSLIPERINLIFKEGYMYNTQNEFSFLDNSWNDGTKIKYIECFSGYYPGENINYIYCKYLKYWKEQINENGGISKPLQFNIELILDKEDKTEQGYKVIDYSCS